jgi:hypothetical protein
MIEKAKANPFSLEPLESRTLLSAAASNVVFHPNVELSPFAGNSPSGGYSPDQIAHAYGFDQVHFADGAIDGDGAGQTIAIVDAYHHPNIAADLHTFSVQFGLDDAPNLTQVNQAGGASDSIATDPGWAYEIALDVEWAHAMAPAANILLVEANSPTLNDLMTAVDYARNAPGVSVVSMSWGGSEFFNQTTYDKVFTTPDGHANVTFVAASGDSGSWYGPQWPATSPNVLSVGGTTLSISDSAGSYAGESGWGYSTGGISRVETEPSYQRAVQLTGARTSPDVSYNANPAAGFAVYSSVAVDGIVGWSVSGGTSAGAPQWAALVAIANQGRAIVGQPSIDGAGTLATLYSLYTAAKYGENFHDVTIGRSSFFASARGGYDIVTGLGSPRAVQVITAMLGFGAPTAMRESLKAPKPSKSIAPPQQIPATTPPVAVAAPTVLASSLSGAAHVLASSSSSSPSRAISFDQILASGGAATAVLGGELLNASGSGAGLISRTGGSPFSNTPVSVYVDSLAQRAIASVTANVEAPAAAIVRGAAGAGKIASTLLSADKAYAIWHLGSPYTLVADAVAAFAEESASVRGAAALGAVPEHSFRSARAWAITFTVVAADAALLSYLYLKRKKTARRAS